jgi:FMN-dependent NADH-azoreductase
MTTILHLICSPRGEASESLNLSRKIIHRLLQRMPRAVVVERILGGQPVAAIDSDYATSQQSLTDLSEAGSMILSNHVVEELEAADIVVIATPMHNFTVPYALKAWIDHVVRVRRTFDIGSAGKIPLLPDRPVYVSIASGGLFSGDRARQPDFLTPYLKAILGTIGLSKITFFSVQGTVFGPDHLAEARGHVEAELDDHFTKVG